MSNFIRFTDTVQFEVSPVSSEKIKDFIVPMTNETKPIVISIAATHAGIITRNNGFYLPDRMRKGASSFIAQYGKPIQVHHNDNADPVGRVINAEYVDISSAVKDKYIKKMKDSLVKTSFDDVLVANQFTRFIDGKMPYIEAVNFIADFMSIKDSVLDDPDYAGLGYIKLTAKISDPEAVRKILDGRYLTGSVGVTTNRAVCSVCKHDWTGDDGRCEHRPGKMYDGAKAFLITGDLVYDEYSFVNTPADRHSRVIEVNTNGITDSFVLEGEPEMWSREDKGSYNLNDSVQEDNMSEVIKLLDSMKERFASFVDEATFAELTTILETEWNTLDEADRELFPVEVEARLDKIAFDKIFSIDTVEKKIEAIAVVRPLLDKDMVTKLLSETYADAAVMYTALNDAEWSDYSESEDEELVKYLSEHKEDAKLSGAQRKRLPSSSFCGPNRSFPVPDCAHVTAARRLIGRASVSAATKTRILGCVSRKASALGCNAKQDAVATEEKVVETITTQVEDKKVECSGCIEKDKIIADNLAAHEAFDKAQLENTNKIIADLNALKDTSTKEVEDLKKVVDNLRTELKLVNDDLTQITDQLISAKEEALVYLADKAVILKHLSGSKLEDAQKDHADLLSAGEAKIKDTVTELLAKVDMNKIADSINSGLIRQPVGNVEDPTINQENKETKIYDKKQVAKIMEEYLRIKFGGQSQYGRGTVAAEQFKKDMQRAGLLPE